MNGMTASMTYDNFGRMTAKEAVVMKNGTPQVATVFSSPVFDNTKIHALPLDSTLLGTTRFLKSIKVS